MDKLKGMTEYVLGLREDKDTDNIMRFWACERYAKFLSQPLTLGMFVPCSLEGEVLEEPEETDLEDSFFSMQKGFNEDKAYQSAKERVLFEISNYRFVNEEHESFYEFAVGGIYIRAYILIDESYWVIYAPHKDRDSFKTIESLVKYNLPLTESAKKKINAK